MDKTAAIKLLGGTLARGVLWATAALSAKFGVDNIDSNTGEAVGMFAAAVIVSAISTWWSKKKDTKLLQADPTIIPDRRN